MQHASVNLNFLGKLVTARNPNSPASAIDEEYLKEEQYFLNLFEIGLFEAYEFLYQHCKNDKHLEGWIITLKGEQFYREKAGLFNRWSHHRDMDAKDDIDLVLSKEQMAFWEENGYLHLENVIPDEDCDSVVGVICDELGIDLDEPETWYPHSDKLQGLMLQLYQGAAIEKNRKNTDVFKIFTQLYGSGQLMANTEKVSYNPPETENFKFKGSPLHWDIDFNAGIRYHIQGLAYLNDVPGNRGAFSLVAGYHKKIEEVLKHSNPTDAMEHIKSEEEIIYLAGKKGDLILWLEAIPHAATANKSDFPRFVQYISFSKVLSA